MRSAFADGKLNVLAKSELEGVVADDEDTAEGGTKSFSVAATRTADFTRGQAVAYGLEYDKADTRI